MELRTFAEQILFSDTLDAKISAPTSISDTSPGLPISSPITPHRPSFLRFKSSESTAAAPPSAADLSQDQARGHLLHYFANHELLATELMALVLLKFPEAPPDFRQGVYRTLLDEQEHTRLYLARMKACGVAFGDLPLSGFFWKCVSRMENPMDYVSMLSLTFEQANLDFCQQFAGLFRTAGDTDSAALLDSIYRDEIRHVAYGLRWFRRWKQSGDSDWDAFCKALRFPLSPRRAKGSIFNFQGRRAAGLTPDFIRNLEVFSRSKGRTPLVSFFNPFSEGFLAHGPGFTPVKHQSQLFQDLESLAQFWVSSDDVVLVRRVPSIDFRSRLSRHGFEIPEFCELSRFGSDTEAGWSDRKLSGFVPWAWGPDSASLFTRWSSCVDSTHTAFSAVIPFSESYASLYSKAFGADLLRTFSDSLDPSHRDWLCLPEVIGRAFSTPDAVFAALRDWRSLGYSRLVAKKAFGIAGQNALRLWEPDISASQRRWIEAACLQPGGVVLEPWLERLCDFSIQLESSDRGLRLVGFSSLDVDHRGQYCGNRAFPGYRRHAPSAVSRALAGGTFHPGKLRDFWSGFFEFLHPILRSHGHTGAVGVDAFVYRDRGGRSRLKPLVELNPRFTMGRLLLELMQRTAPGVCGGFQLLNLKELRERGFESFVQFSDFLTTNCPWKREGSPKALLHSGSIVLNDAAVAEAVIACLHVRPSESELKDALALGVRSESVSAGTALSGSVGSPTP